MFRAEFTTPCFVSHTPAIQLTQFGVSYIHTSFFKYKDNLSGTFPKGYLFRNVFSVVQSVFFFFLKLFRLLVEILIDNSRRKDKI